MSLNPRGGLLQGTTEMGRTFPEMVGRSREERREGNRGKGREEGTRAGGKEEEVREVGRGGGRQRQMEGGRVGGK